MLYTNIALPRNQSTGYQERAATRFIALGKRPRAVRLYNREMEPATIETLIVAGSYAGIFLLMTANGFLSFPSSQILYIIAGYFVSTGTLMLLPVALSGAAGNTLGNVLLYEAVRRYGMAAIERFRIFDPMHVARARRVFERRGLWFLFIGKLLPAIKVFVPIPAGLARVRRDLFVVIMFSASFLWSLAFIAIGFFFGKGADLWRSYAVILALIAFAVVALFLRAMERVDLDPESGANDPGGTSTRTQQ